MRLFTQKVESWIFVTHFPDKRISQINYFALNSVENNYFYFII